MIEVLKGACRLAIVPAVMRQVFFNSMIVGTGGFAGSVARYSLAILLQRYSMIIPVGTLVANLAGCLIIGGIAQFAVPSSLLSPEARLLLATGFCGGFTTLSSMTYEMTQFFKDGEYLHAGGYLAATLFGAIAMFYFGSFLVKIMVKSTGGVWN